MAAETTAQWLAPRAVPAIEAAWADLSGNAVEANPFFAPALLLPALDAFAGKDVRVAIVRDRGERLIALMPVAPARGYSRLPVRYLETWMHEHCFFAAPLLRRGCEAAALSALFDLVENDGAFFRLRHLPAEGAIATAAARVAGQSGRLCASSARYERAMLGGGYETDAVLDASLRGKKRKELRRQRARLEDAGAVRFETLAARKDLELWTQDFLTLERAGWKGGKNSALASNADGAGFFRAALARAFDAGLLDFHRLCTGDKPIAMIVNFIDSGAGYSFKIAYDEDFARFSPGVLLEIEMMRALEQREGLRFIDSCAARDHPMINSLWRERREIEAINISGRSAGAKAMFRLLTGLEQAAENWRSGKRSAANDDL
ncbi:MAG: hypothetical protein A3E78_16485 [Alphaproteobacteria bacterium RIFCSPHIGHO2_12_FULL_63_12]|nr:MAG: hypothetical protein A3E78_16485 [Alphaproteobacteria bacterium RIFCSPHIGHO2_12_FULL_63_12]